MTVSRFHSFSSMASFYYFGSEGQRRLQRLLSCLLVVVCVFCGEAPSNAYGQDVAAGGTRNDVDEVADKEGDEAFERSIEKLKPHGDLVVEAFKETCGGWSSDEVILQTELNDKFLAAVREKLENVDVEQVADAAINWRLMTLRKAGKLKVKATRRAKRHTEDVQALAEIAMRSIQDKSKLSSDRIMADPKWRAEFDAIVKKLQDDADLYFVRKTAFQLRKTRRLQPELISRLADWGRVVSMHAIDDLRKGVAEIDPHPGVYIFRDKTGYLYIGQTENLRKRMAEHLEESHNPALAKYLKAAENATVELHSFDPKSRAKEVRVRRAYESELIRSRKPKFNVLP